MKKMTVYFLLTMVFLSGHVRASDTNGPPKAGPLANFALLEGIALVNAGLAAAAPEEFGMVMTLISPFAFVSEGAMSERWVGFVGFALIGQYNKGELSQEKYSKSDVFLKNLVAFNVVGGLLFLADKLTESSVMSDNLILVSSLNSVEVKFNYYF